ncbi:MAG: alkaline shock response membrane anchor protein AmaP [Firmicutes bacterium]|nr:alkaline shock response membrane anchor protein AmaP [Bacillota bacterium]
MNILRRFLLFLWSLGLITVAAAVGVCALRPEEARFSVDRLYKLLTLSDYFWWLLLAAVVLLLCGMLSLFVSLAKKSAPQQIVIGKSEGGQVNISLQAVDSVVHRAALTVDGVKEVKSRLNAANNGLGISLQIALPHEMNVPETATAVQTAVKEQLQMVTGLVVGEVTVLISTVEGKSYKPVLGHDQKITQNMPEE